MEQEVTQHPAKKAPEQTVDIFVEQVVHNPVFQMSYEHTHPCCELYYLRRGTCVYTVNKAQYHLEAGDLFIVPAGAPHATRYEGAETCERIIVFCRPESMRAVLSEQYPEILRALSTSCKVIINDTLRRAVETSLDTLLQETSGSRRYSGELLKLETASLVLQLLRDGVFSYEEMSPKEGYSSDIEKALKYIALNYSLPLTLAGVAAHCNLCPTYFSRKFKLITGRTFKEHLNFIRLRQATRMLATTDESVTKIALACGFSSSNYFKDLFHKKSGMSPRAYRRQLAPHTRILKET